MGQANQNATAAGAASDADATAGHPRNAGQLSRLQIGDAIAAALSEPGRPSALASKDLIERISAEIARRLDAQQETSPAHEDPQAALPADAVADPRLVADRSGQPGPRRAVRWRGLWPGIWIGTAATSIVTLLQAQSISAAVGYDLTQMPGSEASWYPFYVVKFTWEGLAVLWVLLLVTYVAQAVVTQAIRRRRSR